MGREEQIEEMTQDFINFGITTRQGVEAFAEILYNAGYRQIDENCAVITKAELKEYKRQAVKEFASKLKDKAVDFLYSATVDGHPGFDIHISELCHMIDELLKECLND